MNTPTCRAHTISLTQLTTVYCFLTDTRAPRRHVFLLYDSASRVRVTRGVSYHNGSPQPKFVGIWLLLVPINHAPPPSYDLTHTNHSHHDTIVVVRGAISRYGLVFDHAVAKASTMS
jgi:hypothetical protein